MKSIFFVTVAFLTLSAPASAKSCIPGPDNPGGCMGIPDTLSATDTVQTEESRPQGRDSGGGGRDSGGGGRDALGPDQGE